MPRTASVVKLQEEPTTLSFHDSSDRFARATLLLMQIAQHHGLEINPNVPPSSTTNFTTIPADKLTSKRSILS